MKFQLGLASWNFNSGWKSPYNRPLRALSCSLFILLLIYLPWNIRTNGQYLNCDSIKALKRIPLFLNGRNLATLVKALSFLLAFEQILDTCLSNFRLLSNVIPRSLSYFPRLYLYPILPTLPTILHFYFLILSDDIYRYHVSCNSFQTKQ